MVINKTIAVLLCTAILFTFTFIFAFAVYIPTVEVLNTGYTRVNFADGLYWDFITAELQNNGITVNQSTGDVAVRFNQPSTQWNGLTYIVFDSSGQYDPILTNLNNPQYTARNDRLLWRTSSLNKSQLGQITLDVFRTTYPPLSSTGEQGVPTEKLFHFFLTDASISSGVYQGETYRLYEWENINDVLNLGGDDSGNMPEDFTTFYFDFKLRFDDMNTNVIEGYNICREIALKSNYSLVATTYSGSKFYFPMYNYEINVQSSDGKTYHLYEADFLTGSEAWEDISILYDADFNWSAGSFFSVRFYIVPYGNNPLIPDFVPSSLTLRMFLYEVGYITLENPSVSNTVNTALVNERLARKIVLENDALERFKNQLINDGVISLETGLVGGLHDIGENDVNNIFGMRGKVLTLVTSLMLISSTIALIGFALVGKKG